MHLVEHAFDMKVAGELIQVFLSRSFYLTSITLTRLNLQPCWSKRTNYGRSALSEIASDRPWRNFIIPFELKGFLAFGRIYFIVNTTHAFFNTIEEIERRSILKSDIRVLPDVNEYLSWHTYIYVFLRYIYIYKYMCNLARFEASKNP